MNNTRKLTLRSVADNLDRFHPLSVGDRAALDALPFRTVEFAAGRFLVREGERPEYCGMLLEGYACRHKLAARGASAKLASWSSAA